MLRRFNNWLYPELRLIDSPDARKQAEERIQAVTFGEAPGCGSAYRPYVCQRLSFQSTLLRFGGATGSRWWFSSSQFFPLERRAGCFSRHTRRSGGNFDGCLVNAECRSASPAGTT